MGGGDGHATVRTYLMPPTCMLKNGADRKFHVTCVLPQFLKMVNVDGDDDVCRAVCMPSSLRGSERRPCSSSSEHTQLPDLDFQVPFSLK